MSNPSKHLTVSSKSSWLRNAQFALEQNRARVEAATVAVELARQTLDAEQKKYALGVSTNTELLQTQRDLAVKHVTRSTPRC